MAFSFAEDEDALTVSWRLLGLAFWELAALTGSFSGLLCGLCWIKVEGERTLEIVIDAVAEAIREVRSDEAKQQCCEEEKG
ncbi:hypothetical protein IEQ34_001428 [Dendrobium chrysotoxum]|uniref:Uncharacterized protein n=1 Tax=Dendrobium chrysotoxum TaxID=161865 RepID=A0AAV7HP27_DENCH|nr:hypothetical protein IEQ34_001428 [Dendrobium chrysotoxum]